MLRRTLKHYLQVRSKLINSSIAEVRANPDLMQYYVQEFELHFGYKPNCAGCSLKTDFHRLINALKNEVQPKIKKMSNNKTFVIGIDAPDILTYKNKEGRPVRCYSSKATDEFVIEYLTNGKPEELEERKKHFRKLPKALLEEKKEVKKEVKAKK